MNTKPRLKNVLQSNRVADMMNAVDFDDGTVIASAQMGASNTSPSAEAIRQALQVPREIDGSPKADHKAHENSLQEKAAEAAAKERALGRMLARAIPPGHLEDPEVLDSVKGYIKDFFHALNSSISFNKLPDGEEEFVCDMPRFIPQYDEQQVISHWPTVLEMDVKEKTSMVGNDAFLEFMSSFKKKVQPLFEKAFNKHFEDRFKTLDQSIVGCVYTTTSGFDQTVIKYNKEENDVLVADVSFNEIDNKWVIVSGTEFNIKGHVFREEYELKERPSTPPE